MVHGLKEMENVLYNISQILGASIIHSLWQGMLVYFALRIVFASYPAMPALKKYQLAVLAMVSIAVLFVCTLLMEWSSISVLANGSNLAVPVLPAFHFAVTPPVKPLFYQQFAAYMPYICALYLAGLLANLVKLAGEWSKIRRIKQSLLNAEQMQQFINTFSKKLGITKSIRLKFSELIDVPCILGYFKPLILLPVSLSLSLSACELEAILLHELSHIKRNDYVVNLLQQALSVVLFFNPFNRLINRAINSERENSCDDLVINNTGKPLIYARALLKLETARAHNLQLALAATGSKFYLLKRIERIMKTQNQPGNIRHLLIVMVLFAGALGSIAWFNPASGKSTTANSSTVINHLKANNIADSTENTLVGDTVKHKQKKNLAVKSTSKKHHPSSAKTKMKDFDGSAFADSDANFANSSQWKAYAEAMSKQGEEMRKQFNNPEWKNQMEAIRKQGEEMKKQFDNPEWKNQMLAMQKQGEEMRKKFNSPEWKAQMESIKKQGEAMQKQFNSTEWKAQQEQWKKQAEDFKKQFNSPEWKAQQEQWKKQAEDFKKQFNSPEWKAQQEQWKKQAEQFNGKEWKQQMEQLKNMSKEMRKQFDGKQWKDSFKNQKWILKDSVGGVHIYKPDTVKQ
jgi:bla regulator protein blaR1